MSWYILQLWLCDDASSPIEDVLIIQAKDDSEALRAGILAAKYGHDYHGDAGIDAIELWGPHVDTSDAFFTVKDLEVGYIAEMLTDHKVCYHMNTAAKLAFIQHCAKVLANRTEI